MHVSDVAILHEQRDEMLEGRFEFALSRALQRQPRMDGAPDGAVMVEVDRTQFAQAYEESVLRLENLTPHQREKLADFKAMMLAFVSLQIEYTQRAQEGWRELIPLLDNMDQ